jgi:hypothetical protein
MMGNYHVRFLGGWGTVMSPGYPAPGIHPPILMIRQDIELVKALITVIVIILYQHGKSIMMNYQKNMVGIFWINGLIKN